MACRITQKSLHLVVVGNAAVNPKFLVKMLALVNGWSVKTLTDEAVATKYQITKIPTFLAVGRCAEGSSWVSIK